MTRSRPRVLIDGYFLGKPYGFGRFIGELCRALGSHASRSEFVVAVPSRIDPAGLPRYANLAWHGAPDANFIRWEQVTVPRLARQLACDVVHFPYNTRALATRSIPVVTTVHDLMFLDSEVPVSSGKDYVASRYAKLVFRRCVGRSQAVVSVSDTTRHALRARGIESRTVYNTAEGFFGALPDLPRPAEGPRYVLHRGGYHPHRNTGRVIEAFRAVRGALGGVALKIVGAPGGCERWHTHGDDDIQFLPYVSDAELAALYAGSACVVATSLAEGFGLSIIEGFGFGVPVVTSDRDPMREVAGGAALLVDPASSAEIGRAVLSVLSDDALARDLVARGTARVGTFSSARVAQQMGEVYEACIAAGGAGRPRPGCRPEDDPGATQGGVVRSRADMLAASRPIAPVRLHRPDALGSFGRTDVAHNHHGCRHVAAAGRCSEGAASAAAWRPGGAVIGPARDEAPDSRQERPTPAKDARQHLVVVPSAGHRVRAGAADEGSRHARLRSARGLLLGLAIGIALWACIGGAVLLLRRWS